MQLVTETPGSHGRKPGGTHRLPVDTEELDRARSIGSTQAGGTAILLVSHGSHSPLWRRSLLDVHAEVEAELLQLPGVRQVRSGLMEYTEPSIATQLRACDEAGIDTVIIVPLLLTISDHSHEDIPVIAGALEDAAIAQRLAKEGIEVYPARARLVFAPLLDFTQLVQRNLARRLRTLLGDPEVLRASEQRHGLVLVGYGSAEYEADWHRFFERLERHARTGLGVDFANHAWCGHLVDYRPEPTREAIDAALAVNERVAVVPIFVAYDPMFHKTIIGRAIRGSSDPGRIAYAADAILPEPEVGRWVVDISRQMLSMLEASAGSEPFSDPRARGPVDRAAAF